MKSKTPSQISIFGGGRLDTGRRYGSQKAIASLRRDWREGMLIQHDSNFALTSEKVLLILPFTRLPVQFDNWIWKAPVGHVMETKIGLLVSQMEQAQLRFSIICRRNSLGKQPWPNTSTIFALDCKSGEAKHCAQTLKDKDWERVVQSLSNLAKNEPHPLLNA